MILGAPWAIPAQMLRATLTPVASAVRSVAPVELDSVASALWRLIVALEQIGQARPAI